MAIYYIKDDNSYVISSRNVWIPGTYNSEKTAKYAFRFPDEELQKLQDSISPNAITFKTLQELRKKMK